MHRRPPSQHHRGVLVRALRVQATPKRLRIIAILLIDVAVAQELDLVLMVYALVEVGSADFAGNRSNEHFLRAIDYGIIADLTSRLSFHRIALLYLNRSSCASKLARKLIWTFLPTTFFVSTLREIVASALGLACLAGFQTVRCCFLLLHPCSAL